MARNIGGIVAGIIAAFAIIWLVDLLGHALFPPPAGLGMRDSAAAIGAYLAAMPAGAQFFVALSWFAGALAGGAVAYRISGEAWAAWTIAILVALAAIANIVMIPHPMVLQVAAVVAPLLGGLIARQIGRGRAVEAGAPPAADGD